MIGGRRAALVAVGAGVLLVASATWYSVYHQQIIQAASTAASPLCPSPLPLCPSPSPCLCPAANAAANPSSAAHPDASSSSSSQDRDVSAAAFKRLQIHCFTFNRPSEFKRLWASLMAATPATRVRTEIVIHSDYDPTNSSEWVEQRKALLKLQMARTAHGTVRVVLATHSTGLRATMLEAWSPQLNEYALFLEDDIEVSPLIFTYAEKIILTYGSHTYNPHVLGFKLYNQRWDETNLQTEVQPDNGFKPYLLQEPCSWGSIFVPETYARYMEWLHWNVHRNPYVPQSFVNMWTAERSAKKYMQRFMWEEGLYMVCINLPDQLSLTTNHMAPGTNIDPRASWYESMRQRLAVPLLTAAEQARLKTRGIDVFQTPPIDSLWVYNHQHKRIPRPQRPSNELLKIFNSGELPSASLLDPPHRSGARRAVLTKFEVKLREELLAPAFVARSGPMSSEEIEVMVEMLTTRKSQGGGGVPERLLKLAVPTRDARSLYALTKAFIDPRRTTLFVEVALGLGSRLRALASAMTIAARTGRQLVVIWPQNTDCQASYEELFSSPHPSTIFVSGTGLNLQALVHESVGPTIALVDLLDPANHERSSTLLNELALAEGESSVPPTSHIFLRSAYALSSPSCWHSDKLYMRDITTRPSPAVQAIINDYFQRLAEVMPKGAVTPVAGLQDAEVFHEQMVTGVHVRSSTNLAAEYAGADVDSEEAQHFNEEASVFRQACAPKHFISVLESEPSNRLFIAADVPSSARSLASNPKLQSRAFFIERPDECVARTAACMQYAAADLYLLQRSANVVGSKWSAFSEVAIRGGFHRPVYGCYQPEGGWADPHNGDTFRKQAAAMLSS